MQIVLLEISTQIICAESFQRKNSLDLNGMTLGGSFTVKKSYKFIEIRDTENFHQQYLLNNPCQ